MTARGWYIAPRWGDLCPTCVAASLHCSAVIAARIAPGSDWGRYPMSDLTDRLDEIQARTDAATPGPWEADVTEVSQHWSRRSRATVVSSEVSCMAHCYGGSARDRA